MKNWILCFIISAAIITSCNKQKVTKGLTEAETEEVTALNAARAAVDRYNAKQPNSWANLQKEDAEAVENAYLTLLQKQKALADAKGQVALAAAFTAHIQTAKEFISKQPGTAAFLIKDFLTDWPSIEMRLDQALWGQSTTGDLRVVSDHLSTAIALTEEQAKAKGNIIAPAAIQAVLHSIEGEKKAVEAYRATNTETTKTALIEAYLKALNDLIPVADAVAETAGRGVREHILAANNLIRNNREVAVEVITKMIDNPTKIDDILFHQQQLKNTSTELQNLLLKYRQSAKAIANHQIALNQLLNSTK